MKALRQKLLAAFQTEYREHLERIRAILNTWELPEGMPESPGLDEAFRRAHSLKGAARAVDLPSVEHLAHRLETLLAQVRDGALAVTPPTLHIIRQALDTIEDLVEAFMAGDSLPSTDEVLTALNRIIEGEALLPANPSAVTHVPGNAPKTGQPPAKNEPHKPADTLRLNTATLDDLLRTAGQFQTENLRQEMISTEIAQLAQVMADLHKYSQRLDSITGASIRKLAEMPQLSRLASYLETMDHRIQLLNKRAAAITRMQKRSNWTIHHLSTRLQEDVRRARMVPAESIFGGFRKLVRDLARDEGKEIDVKITGLDVQADRLVLQSLKDPIMHLLRNAVNHGIEPPAERQRKGKKTMGQINLHIESAGNRLNIIMKDDGRGIDIKKVREVAVQQNLISGPLAEKAPEDELLSLIFKPGFSTTGTVSHISGRGIGLSVVHEAILKLQGTIEVISGETPGTCFLISVPLSIATHPILLVECRGNRFGWPCHTIEQLVYVAIKNIKTIEGKPVIYHRNKPVPLCTLGQLLKMDEATLSVAEQKIPALIVKSAQKHLAIVVESFIDVRHDLIVDLDQPLSRLKHLSGGILLEDGTVALVLNPAELIKNLRRREMLHLKTAEQTPAEKPPTIMVVDDSFTTRTLEKSILEAHGYRVMIAVDGLEALEKLNQEPVELVISDIEMPRMDGFELLQNMKNNQRLAQIPVVLVTSIESSPDKERGLSLGADAYIIKKRFDQKELLETIEQIL